MPGLRRALWLAVVLACAAAPVRAGEPVEVSVSCDKSVLRDGDLVAFQGVIRNTSELRFRVFARRKAWAVSELSLYDSGGQLLQHVIKALVSPRPPEQRDFVELRPGGTVALAFNASLRRTTLRALPDRRRQESVLFLDFGESAIVIPGPGTYALEFVLDHDRDAIERLGGEFGLLDVWHGRVVSPRVAIVVQ